MGIGHWDRPRGDGVREATREKITAGRMSNQVQLCHGHLDLADAKRPRDLECIYAFDRSNDRIFQMK